MKRHEIFFGGIYPEPCPERSRGGSRMAQDIVLAIGAVVFFGSLLPAQVAPFEPDEHTVLLMHFDGNLKNECEDANPAKSEVGANEYADGVFGKSLVVLGREDVVVVPESKDYKLSMRATDAFTIELWLKHYETIGAATSRILVCKHTGSSYMVSCDANRISYTLWGSGKWEGKWASFKTEVTIEKDRWTHIAITY